MKIDRREFLATTALAAAPAAEQAAKASESGRVDFRYAPALGQTAFCFPDDHYKSLIGERGELRYGHPGQGKDIHYFPLVAEFGLNGMVRAGMGRQWLEAPGTPIVHTRLDYEEAFLELTTFATSLPDEGRVDNVLLEVRPRTRERIHAVPRLTLATRREARVNTRDGVGIASLAGESAPVLLVCDRPLAAADWGRTVELSTPGGVAGGDQPLTCFFRFPQEGQDAARIAGGVQQPARLLEWARDYWRGRKLFGDGVTWSAPGIYGEFLQACARNILQAREVRDGRLTFQVGPTVYRGLWVVDGNFILEAGRYLGLDAEVQQGLEATWVRQDAEGGIFAGGGKLHWKDTGIAMFTLVRKAELAQDWSYFRKMTPSLLRASGYLEGLRAKARGEGSANGRYGLLARGFGDGGLGGVRSEFTNTLWAVAGLQAMGDAADRLRMAELGSVGRFGGELRSALLAAARQEMRRHPAGFEYLPMLMKEDAGWNEEDEWERPRPQSAQWALSHAIYPGLVFAKDDPVVKGHIALMKAATREDVPAETGWLPHEGIWNYNAPFVSHVYLWAGETEWAARTFTGFLNHATPLYCWREEQPTRGSVYAGYVGDMPHNWASAECLLYLRHMLALEDGRDLRLLAGIGEAERMTAEAWHLAGSPTRFGRVAQALEPENGGRAWRLRFRRENGLAPASVRLPETLGGRMRFASAAGAVVKQQAGEVLVDPAAREWSALWRFA
jgi:hypothetical protein